MYSKLLDEQTLAAVIAASPQVVQDTAKIARMAVIALAKETIQPTRARQETTPQPHLVLMVKELAGMLEGQPSPKAVGLAVRELGLRCFRTRDGYHVTWTRKQVEILRGYLGV